MDHAEGALRFAQLYELAQQEAWLRVLGRHLAADVAAGRMPAAALAWWDQEVARRRQDLGIPRPRPARRTENRSQ